MTLKELEQTIAQLPPAELAEFREWFLRFDGACWDEQIAKDASSEKLASLAETAHREGRPALKGWATFGCRGATTDGTALAQDRWGDKRTSASNGREISAGNAKTPNAKNPGAGPGFWSGEDRNRTPYENKGKTGLGDESGAESGALGAQTAPVDPDLAAVVAAWPNLPAAIRADILAMVGAAS